MEPSQQYLIKQCRAGKPQAFKQVYDLYAKQMLNVCYRMLNKREEAEDVLQEGFVYAFHNLEQFKGTSTFGGWLKTIMVNRCIDRLRKKQLITDSLEERDLEVPAEDTTETDLTASVDQVYQALHHLPDGLRIVFSLYYLEGYDHSEIAQILSISASGSKSQLSKARAKLRLLLNELKSNAYGSI